MASRITKIKRGTGHSYALDGERIPGVTSILGNALPKIGLRQWNANVTAQWAAANHELLHGQMDEDDWIRMASQAPRRESNRTANRGKSIHAAAQDLLSGQAADVPEELVKSVEHAARFMERWDVAEIAAERPCANTAMHYGGTFDLVATLLGGDIWLLDYKTGGVYADNALQLAAYAACDIYQDDDGNDEPMPNVEKMGIVQLSDDGWELIPIRAAWRDLFAIFQHARHVAQFTEWTDDYGREARWPIIGAPLPKPELAS